MPKFEYKAIDPNGREVSGFIDTGTTQEAVSKIKEKGLYPTQINEVKKEQPQDSSKSTPNAVAPAKKGGMSAEICIPFLGIGTVKSSEEIGRAHV